MERAVVHPRAADVEWVALAPTELDVQEASDWVLRPDCGAVVTFTGAVRDHSDGRSGVRELSYEAYEQPAIDGMRSLVAEARTRWPAVGRVAMLHRTGTVGLGSPAVVVAVASAHRAEAFAAASFLIDELKRTVPIWKRESWDGGGSWARGCVPGSEVGR